MSASSSAEQFLRQIQSESLQQFLVSVKHKITPPVLTAVPSLDSYLAAVERPVNGSVISINGPSGSGKTHLLYFLVATCVLPANHPINGWDKAAFVLDLDGYFQMSRFREILVHRLQELLPASDVTRCVERCLKHTHVFRPISSGHLAATLMHLPKYHAKHCPDVDLGMVAIHSIDAFMWFDRFTAEQLRSTFSTKAGAITSPEIFSSLERLRVDYGLSIVLTEWGLSQQVQSASNVTQYQSDNPQSAYTYPHPIIDVGASQTQNSGTTFPVLHRITLTSGGFPNTLDNPGEVRWIARVSDRSSHGVVSMQIMTDGMVIK